jgi:hypothetical protein
MKEFYRKFGLSIDVKKAQEMFRNKIKNIFVFGQLGHDIFRNEKPDIIWRLSNDLGLEYPSISIPQSYEDYYFEEVYGYFWGEEINFENYIFRLQILINILWDFEGTRDHCEKLCYFIKDTLETLSLDLGLRVIIHKTKPPQITPFISKKFEKEIVDTLGLLESSERFKDIVSSYESGLKEFFKAKNKDELRDVVDDMYHCIDSLIQIITGDKNKGFRHVSDKDVSTLLHLNNYQKELFKQLREWMDKIRHIKTSDLEYDKNDIEMIISIVSTLIRYVILKQNAQNN